MEPGIREPPIDLNPRLSWGNKFVRGQVAKTITCEQCGRRFSFESKLRHKKPALDRGGSIKQTEQKLVSALVYEMPMVACPKCGHFQNEMVRQARTRRMAWLWPPFWLAVLVSMMLVLNEMRSRLEQRLLYVAPCIFVVAAVWIIIIRLWRPNRNAPQPVAGSDSTPLRAVDPPEQDVSVALLPRHYGGERYTIGIGLLALAGLFVGWNREEIVQGFAAVRERQPTQVQLERFDGEYRGQHYIEVHGPLVGNNALYVDAIKRGQRERGLGFAYVPMGRPDRATQVIAIIGPAPKFELWKHVRDVEARQRVVGAASHEDHVTDTDEVRAKRRGPAQVRTWDVKSDVVFVHDGHPPKITWPIAFRGLIILCLMLGGLWQLLRYWLHRRNPKASKSTMI